MLRTTAISWTRVTWNPLHGCSRLSEGCRNCYAERLSLQREFTRLPWTAGNVAQNLRLQRHKLREPLSYPRGIRCFVNSMSDLFHEAVPDEYIREVMEIIRQRPDVSFQFLTKRSPRLRDWPEPWPANVWAGVSVENADTMGRIQDLLETDATVKWISAEPLLSPLPGLGATLNGIDWVVVGGETGPHLNDAEAAFRAGGDPCAVNPRWMSQAWAREIRDACAATGTPFYFKQDSGIRTELRPWLVEADGSHTVIQEFPVVE